MSLRTWIALALSTAALAQQTQPKGPWMEKTLSPDARAGMLLGQMTLEEKLQLVHGTPRQDPAAMRSLGGAGFIAGIPRLGIPDLQMADSATGVARGAAFGRYSTALPSTLGLAASWDTKLAYDYGALIGTELRDQGYTMALGGGVNLNREPRNGRNFEYHGEDPILAGTMDGRLMKGEQDQGVIGDIKHFALNDQETGRTAGNVLLDKRAMRETDLLAFEIALKESGAGAVMCSYNKVEGDWACENGYLLNDVLKKAWQFPGFVVSDWGATHSTAKAAMAGLDQEMPGNRFFGDALAKAIESGEVPMARLDDMVRRILRSMFAAGLFDNPPVRRAVDPFAGFEVAQRVAEQGSVLLKNEGNLLPLDGRALKSIAVIGSHADVGVLSGGGSAQVDPAGGNAVSPAPGERRGSPVWHRSSPLAAIRAKAPGAKVSYDPGTDPAAAAALAKASDVTIVIVNQPTSEGRDASLTLPGNQDALVDAVAAANPRTVVVLETGGAVLMPWIGKIGAALEVWYPGIRGGEAIASLLFGGVNPSGRLPITFPASVEDLPHPVIPGSNGEKTFNIPYTEGLKVGYKWYDAEGKKPLFPFGFGLSYTTFAYSGLKVDAGSVTFAVKNTGKRAGAEVAQVYVALPPAANEPPRRLVAWEKVELAPGESKTVTLRLDPKYLSIFNVEKDTWELVPGDYKVMVGPLAGAFKR
jgi:beta-glucosidase